MAKGLNKHTPDSDELLRRLNSNDSDGLDDFEKEALEGFDSLDNIEQAKALTNSLNKRIDEVYFQQEKGGGNKKGFMYLSIAAGLVLIVGLSIFFINLMGDKKEMAMEQAASPEKIMNEITKPADLAPAPDAEPKKDESALSQTLEAKTKDETKSENSFAATGSGDKSIPAEKRAQTQSDKGDGLISRMIVKESKPSNVNKTADSESGDDLKKQEADQLAAQGPPPGNAVSPSVVADSKTKLSEEGFINANEKNAATKGYVSESPASPSNSSLSTSRPPKDAAKKPVSKERKKSSGEYLGKEDQVAANNASNVNGQATGGIAVTEAELDENTYKHNIEFSNHAYSKPQDYIKVEINKNEMLKTNVKAFKAELTINEKGTVTAVKFLTPFDNTCTGCKKELEKILLNMPGWKPTANKKAVKETVSYIDN